MWLADAGPVPATDGESVFLPGELAGAFDHAEALRLYRALALQQAGRALRHASTAGQDRAGWGQQLREPDDPLLRYLFLLSEAAAVDHALAAALPGFIPDLRAVRAHALAQRPPMDRLTARERHVERLLRRVLASDPDRLPEPLMPAATPNESLVWAHHAARHARPLDGPFRELPRGLLVGALRTPVSAERCEIAPAQDLKRAPGRAGKLARRPEIRKAEDGEDDPGPGLCMMPLDDGHEHVEDPMGLQRPADREAEADPDALAESLSELPAARLVSTVEPAAEVLITDDPPERRAIARSKTALAPGIAYPEWDWRIADYRRAGAMVRIEPPCSGAGDPAWADAVIERRRALIAEVQRQFARLRPRRVVQPRQPDGDDIDLDAFVAAHAERCAGGALAERLYRAERRARRDMAVLLLVDASGSTDGWVAASLRIIDVEKEALLVACRALDALGDPYAIQAFASEGPHCVRVYPLKAFDERATPSVDRRIAALEPDGYTRAGAAVRHATEMLATTGARHRVLLLLSDGRPNDIDHYEGQYGIEDLRQAVAEAVAIGIHPFCLTVDRQAPAYLPRVFGRQRFALLDHPERLPGALVDVVRRLVRG